jgi:hypothetical protein
MHRLFSGICFTIMGVINIVTGVTSCLEVMKS